MKFYLEIGRYFMQHSYVPFSRMRLWETSRVEGKMENERARVWCKNFQVAAHFFRRSRGRNNRKESNVIFHESRL